MDTNVTSGPLHVKSKLFSTGIPLKDSYMGPGQIQIRSALDYTPRHYFSIRALKVLRHVLVRPITLLATELSLGGL